MYVQATVLSLDGFERNDDTYFVVNDSLNPGLGNVFFLEHNPEIPHRLAVREIVPLRESQLGVCVLRLDNLSRKKSRRFHLKVKDKNGMCIGKVALAAKLSESNQLVNYVQIGSIKSFASKWQSSHLKVSACANGSVVYQDARVCRKNKSSGSFDWKDSFSISQDAKSMQLCVVESDGDKLVKGTVYVSLSRVDSGYVCLQSNDSRIVFELYLEVASKVASSSGGASSPEASKQSKGRPLSPRRETLSDSTIVLQSNEHNLRRATRAESKENDSRLRGMQELLLLQQSKLAFFHSYTLEQKTVIDVLDRTVEKLREENSHLRLAVEHLMSGKQQASLSLRARLGEFETRSGGHGPPSTKSCDYLNGLAFLQDSDRVLRDLKRSQARRAGQDSNLSTEGLRSSSEDAENGHSSGPRLKAGSCEVL